MAQALGAEVLALDRGQPARYRRRRVDGKVIEVGSDPTPDGGFVVTHTDVTELSRAQDEASARAAVLQLMLDNMRHGIAQFDRDKRLVTANRLAAEFNGIDPALLRPGVDAAELALASLRAGMMTAEAVQAGLADDYTRPQRRTRVRPDGRVIEIFTDPTPDGGFVATYSDVTALTEAEAEARKRAGILQVMLDNLRHGIQLFDADQRLIAANRLAADLAGYPGDQLPQGALLADLITEQFRAGAIRGDQAMLHATALSIDRSAPARYIRPHRDGRVIEVTSDPTPDGGFVITMADISALAEAEQAAQHRTALLQAMLDNSRQGVILFDMEGRILAANGIAADLNRVPADQLQPGITVRALIEAQGALGYFDAPTMAEALSLVPEDRPWPTPYSRRRTLGHNRIVEVTTDSVGGVGYIRSYRDISEELRARAELERAKDAAETANKAKSRFLATMSHELRTPLNAVIGFSEAITADPDPVRGKEYVRSIHEAGRHLLSLIDDILDVARAETVGFTTTESEVAPIPLLEGVVRVMQATAATAGVAVVQALPAALPLLRADALRLRQVLLNLVSNAVKFTPQGGLVTLSAEEAPEGGLVMRVTDSGIGIRPEDIPRAFEPFTQLDSSLSRRFPGSGLGLYLSRALAEAQGATLTLESVPGAGTTAMLCFPKSRLITSLAA
ncbi:PAS-domain containing protein [Dankookia sp. P2]|uniref:PAS-domain containing protein n=1 Tax=Dankookia sp. P2 TaxID=3423955 RepID=UPI003D6708FE